MDSDEVHRWDLRKKHGWSMHDTTHRLDQLSILRIRRTEHFSAHKQRTADGLSTKAMELK
jgi:hypothetical protein